MKRLIQNYTFDSSEKTVTILCECNLTLDKLLVITNVTKGIIIYNFADSNLVGSINGNIITLNYDTTAMSDSDILQIWIEDINPLSVDFSNFFSTVRNLLTRLSFDATSQLRVLVSSLPTVTTVTTVATANTSFGDSGKYATQQLISQNVVSNSFNKNIVRS